MNPISRIQSDADITDGLACLLALDPRLVPIAQIAGPLPLRLSEPGFAGLASIIVSQMVSRASAQAIWGRLSTAMGVPSPAAYLALGDQALALGQSRAKHACLTSLSQAVLAGEIDLAAVLEQPGEVAIAELTRLRGIGLWTAEVYLMFCAGHADVFPAGDVALRIAVGQGLGLPERPDIALVRHVSKDWQPFRSIAARLFWGFYAKNFAREALPLQSL
ncbi:DNA-3-methyladenine glycosylase 2 family protein [Rhizobium sp.]|jgi:DNA-3-methyladenine glycosylase II|uniref:DNA-3-methyladenine glycosylase family protein n=1 Tax=Rhizobium sp. TaxID=391 RepID=UPI000E8BD144|nr:DNA-3-methyladenine glycosidase [Rhizobium sp.]